MDQSSKPVFVNFANINMTSDAFIVLLSGFFLFLFLDDLTEKLKFIQNKLFEGLFSDIFPPYGSIVDMNLSYTPVTEDEKKAAARKTEAK